MPKLILLRNIIFSLCHPSCLFSKLISQNHIITVINLELDNHLFSVWRLWDSSIYIQRSRKKFLLFFTQIKENLSQYQLFWSPFIFFLIVGIVYKCIIFAWMINCRNCAISRPHPLWVSSYCVCVCVVLAFSFVFR